MGSRNADVKEFFQYFPWGQYPSETSDAARRLFDEASALASELLGWIEANMPAHITTRLSMPLSKMLDGNHRTMLRILRYPPLTGEEEPDALRAAPHEDANFLTVLPSRAVLVSGRILDAIVGMLFPSAPRPS